MWNWKYKNGNVKTGMWNMIVELVKDLDGALGLVDPWGAMVV